MKHFITQTELATKIIHRIINLYPVLDARAELMDSHLRMEPI